ncbi:DUF6159 family protein [Pedosphaera parvula]|uniref:Transmembrane protein n=1 Tax=Pedosphaera parvula (strain Ellin514) TaxID=320771 RepID=B9XQ66_PEDPL|nr:DUF6159 family protein [Pedosphaera parvula]EEF57984.1 hypothetical protein Cflav_PD0949 [Pedosphaera parvula Ellin514]
MEKFRRSWELFKSSLYVMQQNKKLLVFPILTATFTIIITMLFILPVAFQPTGYSYTSGEHWGKVVNTIYDTGSMAHSGNHYGRYQALSGVKPLGVAYFAAMYFVSMFCATFFNVAFYSQILSALGGGSVTVGGGLRFACGKWKQILMWTAFAGLIGFIIKSLEQRFGIVGQIVMKLVGAAWSIACVFVIPVIVTDEEAINPVKVLKKSAVTLTRTWGESLIGYVGVSFGGSIIMLISLVWLAGGIFAAIALHSVLLGVMVGVSWLFSIIVLSYIMSVASQIFRCALFLYAAHGDLPQPYTSEMMELAWKVKKG